MLRAALCYCAALVFAPQVFAGTVEDIKASGILTCGLDANRPGFSVRNADYTWTGFDVDLCRAIAAAVAGDPKLVNLMPLNAEDRVVALQAGEVDVLLHGLAWTQGADAKHGLMFVAPHFVGPEIYAPMVRQGDDQWFQVVRCVVQALLLPGTSEDPALDAALQLQPGWRQRAVAAAGTHAEMLARHFAGQVPDQGNFGAVIP